MIVFLKFGKTLYNLSQCRYVSMYSDDELSISTFGGGRVVGDTMRLDGNDAVFARLVKRLSMLPMSMGCVVIDLDEMIEEEKSARLQADPE